MAEVQIIRFFIHTNFSLDITLWGIANPIDIVKLLDSTISEFYSNLDSTRLPMKSVLVCNSRRMTPPLESPMIFQQANQDVIFLTSQDLSWSQYSYQFTHELCHHIINSSFFRGIDRFGWLEETLCELASIYTLNQMSNTWLTTAPYSHWSSYASSLGTYSADILNKPTNAITDPLNIWLSNLLPALQTNRVMRTENTVVASQLFPLFQQSPELWQTIQYINTITVTVDMELATFLNLWKMQLPVLLQSKFSDVEQILTGAIS